MGKLKIVVNSKTKDSIAKTIRMSGNTYDKISSVAEKNKITFNKVANQLLEYALDNLED